MLVRLAAAALLLLPVLVTTAGPLRLSERAGEGGPLVQAVRGGEMRVAVARDALASLGLSVERVGDGSELALLLGMERPLQVELGDGAPTSVREGALVVHGLTLVRGDGRRSPALWLQPADGAGLDLELRDASGAVWMRVSDAMRSPDPAHGLRFATADLRVGPALAAWAGRGGEGLLLGNVMLQVPLAPGASTAVPKSCSMPNWPGTPGYVTDVSLVDMRRVDVLRCRVLGDDRDTCGSVPAFTCDGPGGSEGQVVLTPSATLRNRTEADAADVPWYRKFSGSFPPYGNDQHPYLVWNLYRIDADGALTQIGRSGLKHAFATQNQACDSSAGCSPNGHILGRSCRDEYNVGSNDLYSTSGLETASALAPRNEVIPATGQWGRCGSDFDDIDNATGAPGCDGQFDAPPATDCRYRHRLVARESAIDPALHPGARWFVEAWYVVRDDENVFNTIGSVEIAPEWLADAPTPRWSTPLVPLAPGEPPAFRGGPVLDLWHAWAPGGVQSQRSVLETADGQLLLVTRVQPEGGAYRYDYALMNLDFSRAITAGAEPDLQVLESSGIGAVRLGVAGHSAASDVEAVDGVRSNDDALQPRSGCAGPAWSAAVGNDFAWGSMVRLSFRSAHAPVAGQLVAVPTDGEEPATLSLDALVPDAGVIFCDPFE